MFDSCILRGINHYTLQHRTPYKHDVHTECRLHHMNVFICTAIIVWDSHWPIASTKSSYKRMDAVWQTWGTSQSRWYWEKAGQRARSGFTVALPQFDYMIDKIFAHSPASPVRIFPALWMIELEIYSLRVYGIQNLGLILTLLLFPEL